MTPSDPKLASDPSSAALRGRARPRRKPGQLRWLLRGVIVLLLLVIVGVGAAPWALSQPNVRDAVFQAASNSLEGELRVAGLSLSWLAPSRVSGLTVLDNQRREVLSVREIRSSKGLWGLIRGGFSIGQIDVDEAKITLVRTADGQYKLKDALRPRAAADSAAQPLHPAATGRSASAEDAADGAVPDVRGKLVLTNCEISVIHDEGQTLTASDLNATIAIETFNDIQGTLSAQLAGSGRVDADVQLRQLARNGRIDPEQAVGHVRLSTDALAVGPLAAFAGQDVTGAAKLDLQATLDGRAAKGTVAAEVKNLVAAQAAAAGVQPLDLTFRADVGLSDRVFTLLAELVSAAGDARADLNYRLGEEALDGRRLLAAALTGESVTLPDLTLTAQANLDLAQVERAIPGVLKIRADRRITAGRLAARDVQVRLGAAPVAQGQIELRELTVAGSADPAGAASSISPILLSFDTELQPGQGLFLRRLELQSAFAELTASGLLKNLSAGFRADLARLEAELGRVFELGATGWSGALNGTLTAAQPSDDRIDLNFQAAAEQVRFTAGQQTFDLPRAALRHNGHLVLAGQTPERLIVEEAAVDLNRQVLVNAKGMLDLAGGGFEATLDARQVDLSFLAQQSAALGLHELARYSGVLTGTARAAQAGRDRPLIASGALRGQGLAVDGQPLVERDVALTWTDTEIEPGTGGVRVAAARFESAIANLSASEVRIAAGPPLTLNGRVQGAADLTPVLAAVSRIARLERPPAIAGQLSLDTVGTADDRGMTVVGTAQIDQFTFGEGAGRVPSGRVDLAYDARINPQAEELRVERFALNSTPLTGELSGTLTRYRSTADLALAGRYDASWPELTRLLHELAPATRTLVEISGRSASEFEVQGAANQPGAQPAFRAVRGGLGIGWESARLYGVGLGSARFEPALRDGRLTLPLTTIAAADGKVNLGGVLDFQPAEPALRIDGRLNVLENVALSKVLAEALLSYFNPVFSSVVSVEGRVNLAVEGVLLPFGATMQSASQGTGRLDLQTVRMQAGGPLMELLALGGLVAADAYAVQFSAVDFRVRDGRIVYDNFRMVFPQEFDLIFRGSVGFDSTLDLIVSIPVRPELLQRLGLKGASAEMAQRFAGARIDVPLVGTREQPRLDFAKVDTSQLMQGLLPKPEQAIGDLLKGITGSGQPAQPGPGGSEAAPPADKKPERGIGDLLRKLPGGG